MLRILYHRNLLHGVFFLFICFLCWYILQFHFKPLKHSGHNIFTFHTVYLRILRFEWLQKQQLIFSLYKSNRLVWEMKCHCSYKKEPAVQFLVGWISKRAKIILFLWMLPDIRKSIVSLRSSQTTPAFSLLLSSSCPLCRRQHHSTNALKLHVTTPRIMKTRRMKSLKNLETKQCPADVMEQCTERCLHVVRFVFDNEPGF